MDEIKGISTCSDLQKAINLSVAKMVKDMINGNKSKTRQTEFTFPFTGDYIENCTLESPFPISNDNFFPIRRNEIYSDISIKLTTPGYYLAYGIFEHYKYEPSICLKKTLIECCNDYFP